MFYMIAYMAVLKLLWCISVKKKKQPSLKACFIPLLIYTDSQLRVLSEWANEQLINKTQIIPEMAKQTTTRPPPCFSLVPVSDLEIEPRLLFFSFSVFSEWEKNTNKFSCPSNSLSSCVFCFVCFFLPWTASYSFAVTPACLVVQSLYKMLPDKGGYL